MTEPVTHPPAVERRLDLLSRIDKMSRALFNSSTRSVEEIIQLAEWCEAAEARTTLMIPHATFEVSEGLNPEGVAIFTGRATTGPPTDLGFTTGIEVLGNDVGDGSDVGTDVWPAAVPAPNYDDVPGLRHDIDSTTSDDDVSPESTTGKDD